MVGEQEWEGESSREYYILMMTGWGKFCMMGLKGCGKWSMHKNEVEALPGRYEIRVRGQLDPTWTDWFDQFEIRYTNGDTDLVGPVADQAALVGLLLKIHNLGLNLVSVNRLQGMMD